MLLMATVDDVPGEVIPYFVDKVMEAGANNVHIVNALTKKNRVEYIIFIDVDTDRLDDICGILALEFGTIGARILESRHIMLDIESSTRIISIKYGEGLLEATIRVKYAKKYGHVISLKAEFEDIKKVAAELSGKGINIGLSKLKALVEAEAFNDVLETKNIHVNIK